MDRPITSGIEDADTAAIVVVGLLEELAGTVRADVADLVLDQKAPAGDSAVWVDGLESPVAPVSSVSGCTLINLLKAEVAQLLTRTGQPPKVLTAACHVGADRARELFEATYDDYRRRIGVLYS